MHSNILELSSRANAPRRCAKFKKETMTFNAVCSSTMAMSTNRTCFWVVAGVGSCVGGVGSCGAGSCGAGSCAGSASWGSIFLYRMFRL